MMRTHQEQPLPRRNDNPDQFTGSAGEMLSESVLWVLLFVMTVALIAMSIRSWWRNRNIWEHWQPGDWAVLNTSSYLVLKPTDVVVERVIKGEGIVVMFTLKDGTERALLVQPDELSLRPAPVLPMQRGEIGG